MKRLHFAIIGGAAFICTESSEQQSNVEPPILPEAIIEIIEATPCPEASGLGVEECLVWLTPQQPLPLSSYPGPGLNTVAPDNGADIGARSGDSGDRP